MTKAIKGFNIDTRPSEQWYGLDKRKPPKPVDTDRLWRQLKTSGRMCFSLGLPERVGQ